jgi:hypothetical protein
MREHAGDRGAGEILDGRHRSRACTALGLELHTQEYTGTTPVAFACELNLHRRHLTLKMRTILALEVAPLYEQEARAANAGPGGDRRSAAHESNAPHGAREPFQIDRMLSRRFNVSERTLERVEEQEESISARIAASRSACRCSASARLRTPNPSRTLVTVSSEQPTRAARMPHALGGQAGGVTAAG